MKKIFLIIIVLSISGCASKMPENKYALFGNVWSAIQQCTTEGYYSHEYSGEATKAFYFALSSWSYDLDKLNTQIEVANTVVGSSQHNCNRYANTINSMIAQAGNRRTANAASAQAMRDMNQVIQNNRPTTTICNSAGTTTICNSN